jgi:acyl-CoA thioesterase-1
MLARRWSVLFMVLTLALGLSCSKESSESEGAPPSKQSEAQSTLEEGKAAVPSAIFLGDSLTAGYGLSESQAYPALIEKKLAARGTKYRIINAGRSGDTTAGGLSRLGWYLKDRVNPRVLVIFLGSNDAIRGVPLETMEKNLRAIVEKARAFRKDLRIFLVELRTFPNLGADYGEEFREVFVRVAEDAKVELISYPLLEVAGRPELNQAAGVHPNEDGTKKVAEVIWVAVEGKLGGG